MARRERDCKPAGEDETAPTVKIRSFWRVGSLNAGEPERNYAASLSLLTCLRFS